MVPPNQTNIIVRTLLYLFLFGILLWPLFFIVNLSGLVIMSLAVLPFSTDFQKYDATVRVISIVSMIIPYLLVGFLYFTVDRRFIFKVSVPLHLFTFLVVIVSTMVLKIVVLLFITQTSFFASRTPLNYLSILNFVSLEIVVFISTVTASIYSARRTLSGTVHN